VPPVQPGARIPVFFRDPAGGSTPGRSPGSGHIPTSSPDRGQDPRQKSRSRFPGSCRGQNPRQKPQTSLIWEFCRGQNPRTLINPPERQSCSGLLPPAEVPNMVDSGVLPGAEPPNQQHCMFSAGVSTGGTAPGRNPGRKSKANFSIRGSTRKISCFVGKISPPKGNSFPFGERFLRRA